MWFAFKVLANVAITALKVWKIVDNQLYLKAGERMIYGAERNKGLVLRGTRLETVTIPFIKVYKDSNKQFDVETIGSAFSGLGDYVRVNVEEQWKSFIQMIKKQEQKR